VKEDKIFSVPYAPLPFCFVPQGGASQNKDAGAFAWAESVHNTLNARQQFRCQQICLKGLFIPNQ
jgi:hypothetical protein